MKIIHFTEGVTNELAEFNSRGARFVPLADGDGDTHVSCIHLAAGAEISAPPLTHDSALLIVHGSVTVVVADSGAHLELSSGVGMVVEINEGYALKSSFGAILIVVESGWLEATELGISTPARIAGQRWPGECSKIRSD